MSTKPVLLAIASTFSSLSLGAAGAVACELVKVAEAPLFVLGNHYATSITLNEATRPIIVDTGAAFTNLTPRVVDEFKLKTDALAKPTAVFGIGQTQAVLNQNVIVPVFGLGGLVYRDRSTVVSDMAFGKTAEGQAIGLLGDDIMSNFDVEFDFPSGKLAFYHTFQCYASFAPWAGEFVMVPFDHHDAKLVIDVVLDQERTRAIVDTGNNVSFVSRQSSALWDVSDSELRETHVVSTSPFNGGTSSSVKSYTFETVGMGGKTYHQMRMNVVDVDLLVGTANLGLDYWRTRKVWISYSRNWMFIADHPAAATLAHPVRDAHPGVAALAPPVRDEQPAPEEVKTEAKEPVVRRRAPRMSDPLALPPGPQ